MLPLCSCSIHTAAGKRVPELNRPVGRQLRGRTGLVRTSHNRASHNLCQPPVHSVARPVLAARLDLGLSLVRFRPLGQPYFLLSPPITL
jgi:hypothetical protein